MHTEYHLSIKNTRPPFGTSIKSRYLAFKFALASKIPLDQIHSHVSPPPERGWRALAGDASRGARFLCEERLHVL